MKGDITAVRNTLFDDYQGPRLPRQVQLERVKRVVAAELTPLQRETLLAYYFQGEKYLPDRPGAWGEQEHRLPHPAPGGKPPSPLLKILNNP